MNIQVSPVDQKAKTEDKMRNESKTDQYLVYGMHMFIFCLGLSPYKINKETGEVFFRWFSCKTIWSLIRLVLFNSPFSFLPVVLFAFFGTAELKQEDLGGFSNCTSSSMSRSTAIVYSAVSLLSISLLTLTSVCLGLQKYLKI